MQELLHFLPKWTKELRHQKKKNSFESNLIQLHFGNILKILNLFGP
jgi:hypothetical protein